MAEGFGVLTQRAIDQPWYPYLVTTVVAERRSVFVNRTYAREFGRMIQHSCERTGFCLFAYAILPDHVHLVVWREPPPKFPSVCWNTKVKNDVIPRTSPPLSKLMQLIKGGFSRKLGVGILWQPRFNFRILDTRQRFIQATWYVFRNYRKDGLPRQFGRSPYAYLNVAYYRRYSG